MELLKVYGWPEVYVYSSRGELKYAVLLARGNPVLVVPKGVMPETTVIYYFRKNVVTNAGLAEIVKLVFGLGGNVFKYVAIGTGTTPESVADTALESELARKVATVSQTTMVVENDTAVLEATFSSGDGLSGSKSICEAGVFNASTGGVLLARKVFACVPVNFDAGDSITIRYYVQMSR